jgi:hypothetical protein
MLALPPPPPCIEARAQEKDHRAIIYVDRGRLLGCIRRQPARMLLDCSGDSPPCLGWTEPHLNGPLAAFSAVGNGRCAWSTIKVVDLRTGATRLDVPVARRCDDTVGEEVGAVGRIVLRGGGAVAFAWRSDADVVTVEAIDERGRRMLDRGRKLSPESLVRRGDRILWWRDGHRRSAALGHRPPPP